jgi:hemolysin III
VGWLVDRRPELQAGRIEGLVHAEDRSLSVPHSQTPLAKPKLRGVLHQWASVAALIAGVVLVSTAQTPRVAIAAGLFAGSLVALFTISASYHRINWSAAAQARMRRLDHSTIFVLIAGTYTPIAMLGLPRNEGNSLLVAIWAAAVVGIMQSVFWVDAPRALTAGLAVAVGWMIVPYFGEAHRSLTPAEFFLIIAGGVTYTLGAVAYATKRPDPHPAVFGYHEVFHASTLVGGALHFAAVTLLAHGATLR